jgi:hypothetical protein
LLPSYVATACSIALAFGPEIGNVSSALPPLVLMFTLPFTTQPASTGEPRAATTRGSFWARASASL